MKADLALLTIVKNLVATPDSEMDAGINRMLEQIADALDLGQVWLFRHQEDMGVDATYSCSHASCALPLGLRVLIKSDLPPHWFTQAALPEVLEKRMGLLRLTFSDAHEIYGIPVRRSGRLAGFLVIELPPGQQALPASYDFALGELAEIMLCKLGYTVRRIASAGDAATLAALVEAIPDLLFEIDVEGRYTGLAAGPRHLMLVPPEELRGRRLIDVLPPEAGPTVISALEGVLHHGQVANLTYHLDLVEGRRYFAITGSRREPAHPQGQPTAVFLVRDVTEAEEMGIELRRLGSIAQVMSNLVTIIDTNMQVTWVNLAFEQHTGWTLAEIKGRNIRDVVRCPESDPAVVAAIDEAIEDLRPFIGQIINKDRFGNRYYVDFNILPLFRPDGSLEGYVAVETVVTRLKQQQLILADMAEAAAAANLRLANALAALPDSVLIFDAEEKLVVANPSFSATFPEMADDLWQGNSLSNVGAAWQQCNIVRTAPGTGPEDLATLLHIHHQIEYSGELELHDGRWFRMNFNRTTDGGLVLVLIDITARHKQWAALEAVNQEMTYALNELDLAKRRLSSIMEATRVGTWELEFPAGMLTLSRQWGNIIGVEGNGRLIMAHSEFLDLIHPDDRARLEPKEPTNAEGDLFEHEFRMRHVDGQWVWILSRGRVVNRDDQGEPTQIVGVDLDISHQKQLEIEARLSEAFLQSAMESSVAAIAIYDADDILLYCNTEARVVLGLLPGVPCGRDPDGPQWVLETLDGTPMGDEFGPCDQARKAGRIIRDMRFVVRWPNGHRQVLSCNATPAGPDSPHIVLSFWDITDQLEATERLTQALAHAEEINRAKSIFLANMSHEIRTPLNGVLGMAEVLSLQVTNPEHSRMIKMIRQSGETLLAVLNSILDMSKIEAGKMEIERIPFSLQDLLQQVEMVYSILAEEKGLDFDLSISSGCEILRIGDPHRIHQVLHNLLSNAIKFSSAGSISLTVTCRVGQPVLFEVVDQGVGMTAEQSERVFRSFEQADGSMTRRFGGTGLGLSIVRELVSLMGGTLDMESQLDIGTRIVVTLPLEPA